MLAAALLDLAADKGLGRAELARAVGLRPEVDPDDRVPLATVLELWAALIARFPSEHLGLELGARWRAPALGLLGYLAANATSLGEALERLVAFQALVDGENRLSYVVREGALVVTLAGDPALTALRQPVEAQLASGHAFFQLLGRAPLVARRARMRHRSTLAPGPYRAFFGVPVEFGARHDELVYDAEILDRPIPSADARLGAYLLHAAEATSARLSEARAAAEAEVPERLAREVRRRLSARVPVAIDPVARALGTSVRALQRSLGEGGTSFRDVVDAERRRVAELLLASPGTSLGEIADALGFAELASFSRAFKRWTRSSPAAFRRRLGTSPRPDHGRSAQQRNPVE
jgi:AraC-like DNA-binding protein